MPASTERPTEGDRVYMPLLGHSRETMRDWLTVVRVLDRVGHKEDGTWLVVLSGDPRPVVVVLDPDELGEWMDALEARD